MNAIGETLELTDRHAGDGSTAAGGGGGVDTELLWAQARPPIVSQSVLSKTNGNSVLLNDTVSNKLTDWLTA